MKSLRTGPTIRNKENDVNYIKIKDRETKDRHENTTDWRGYDTRDQNFQKLWKPWKLKKFVLRRFFLGCSAIFPLKRTKWQLSYANISLNTNKMRVIFKSTDINSKRPFNDILRQRSDGHIQSYNHLKIKRKSKKIQKRGGFGKRSAYPCSRQ